MEANSKLPGDVDADEVVVSGGRVKRIGVLTEGTVDAAVLLSEGVDEGETLVAVAVATEELSVDAVDVQVDGSKLVSGGGVEEAMLVADSVVERVELSVDADVLSVTDDDSQNGRADDAIEEVEMQLPISKKWRFSCTCLKRSLLLSFKNI